MKYIFRWLLAPCPAYAVQAGIPARPIWKRARARVRAGASKLTLFPQGSLSNSHFFSLSGLLPNRIKHVDNLTRKLLIGEIAGSQSVWSLWAGYLLEKEREWERERVRALAVTLVLFPQDSLSHSYYQCISKFLPGQEYVRQPLHLWFPQNSLSLTHFLLLPGLIPSRIKHLSNPTRKPLNKGWEREWERERVRALAVTLVLFPQDFGAGQKRCNLPVRNAAIKNMVNWVIRLNQNNFFIER